MTYLPLIFAKEKTPVCMDTALIEDLKLELLLSPAVCKLLLCRPEGETVSLRSEMFSAMLSDDGARATVSGLLSELKAASKLYRALNRAISEKAGAFIFASLFKRYSDFCRKAASAPSYGQLFARFSKTFAEVTGNERFAAAYEKSEVISKTLDSVRGVSLKITGDEVKVSLPQNDGISASLISCANELEIPLTSHPETEIELRASIPDALARLAPDVFEPACEFFHEHRALVSGEIFGYIEELEFILGILDFCERVKAHGLPLSFPRISKKKKIALKNVYDFTLIAKEAKIIVPNDVNFDEKEPFFYLTGANGGGKTTYLRAVGCNVVLFLAGAPAVCDGGECCVFDAVFTHFPRDERFEGSGRFFDEIDRVNRILERENGSSLILLNETYATTGEEKALEYTAKLAEKLNKSGSFGLYITHQHEVGESKVPFLGVVIDALDGNKRTYRIEKRRLPPKSFAADILEKYGLTKEALDKRFGL